MATGRVNYEQPLEVGDRIEIGGQHGIVSTIEPVLRERDLRLERIEHPREKEGLDEVALNRPTRNPLERGEIGSAGGGPAEPWGQVLGSTGASAVRPPARAPRAAGAAAPRPEPLFM